jgi:RNA-directed DNA polymerase
VQFALTVPCMVDRAMQALHLLALEPVSETCADLHSYGFRRDRSTADAIEQCFTALAKKTSPQWILEGDIRACFDEISHSWLITNVPTDTVILRKWLKAGYIEDRQLFPTNAGTPQGGIISPAISNWALDGLQYQLAEKFLRRQVDGKWIRPKVGLVRYADDFVITGYSKELLEDEVKPLVEAFLQERGLTLSPEKKDHAHLARVRLPRAEHPKISERQVTHQAIKKECSNVSDESTRSHQGQCIGQTGQSHRSAQSAHRWLGELPSTRGFEGSL